MLRRWTLAASCCSRSRARAACASSQRGPPDERGAGGLTGRSKLSAGLLLYRHRPGLEVMLVHMGGPFWAKRDDGGWSIPKGEYIEGEDPLAVARREFEEEIGRPAPPGDPELLGEVRQPSGKLITAFALAADLDVTSITSNTFPLQWPPRSGRIQHFPEVDRAGWFPVGAARAKLVAGQVPFLDRLLDVVSEPDPTA